MFSFSGNAYAATAAHPATAPATPVARLSSSDSANPKSAKVPAKPMPQCTGMASANTMPTSDGTCQASQLVDAPPQKYGSCSGAGWGSGKRRMNIT